MCGRYYIDEETAIYRASYLNARINPVNGGISKDKHKAGEEVYYE